MPGIDICMFVCHPGVMAKKIPMKRTTVYLPVKVHRAMKVMAALNDVSMADLLRDALVQVYKDDQADVRASRAAAEHARRHPESVMSAREYFARRNAMESRRHKPGSAAARRNPRD